MKRDIVTKRAIQVVACGFGLLGLIAACMGVSLAIGGIHDSDRRAMLWMAPQFLLLGGIPIAIAWQALRHFGPNAIRNVVGFFMFLAWSLLAWFPESSQHGEPRWQGELLEIALVLGPLYLALLLYRVLSRKLIQMTGTAIPSNGPTPANDKRERNPRETTVSDLHISHPRSDA
jgi:hypothetical protein